MWYLQISSRSQRHQVWSTRAAAVSWRTHPGTVSVPRRAGACAVGRSPGDFQLLDHVARTKWTGVQSFYEDLWISSASVEKLLCLSWMPRVRCLLQSGQRHQYHRPAFTAPLVRRSRWLGPLIALSKSAGVVVSISESTLAGRLRQLQEKISAIVPGH